MKTKEFIKKVKELGYEVKENHDSLWLIDPNNNLDSTFDDWFVYVYTQKPSSFEYDIAFTNIDNPNLKKVVLLTIDYSFTPINERKEEAKFKVHLLPGAYGWLNNDRSTNDVYATDDDADKYYQTTFTNNQYNEIRSKMLAKGYVLPEYDKNNTTTFVPVEDGEDEWNLIHSRGEFMI